MKWTARDTAAIGAITVVIIAFFFRLFFPVPQLIITPDFGQSDAISSFATKYFYSVQLAQHHIPLWTSQVGGGYPIFALGTMASFYLPNLLFYTLLPPVLAYNSVLVISFCCMGWGMYAWLKLSGYRRIACLFGSITTGLCGYAIVQLTHITIVQSYSLFPILAFLTLSLANKKSWLTVGWFILTLSQQIFIGFPQCVFITLLFVGAYWLWLLQSATEKGQKTFLLIVAVVGGCLAAAVQIFPSVEYLKTLVTANGYSAGQSTYFSFPFKHLITLVNPFALGNPAHGTYPNFLKFDGSIFWENTAFIGVIPLIVLTVYALSLCFKKLRHHVKENNIVYFYILVLFSSLLLAAGKYSPLYLLYSFWPFNLFRVPSRFIWLFEIVLILLSTHAFDRLMGYVKQTKLLFLTVVLIISIHTLSLFIVWSSYHDTTPASSWVSSPILSLYIDRTYFTLDIGAEQQYDSAFLRGWSDGGDADLSYFLRNTFTADKNLLWDVPQIGDYAGRAIRRSRVLTDLLSREITADFTDATVSAVGTKLLSTFSIKNIISTLPLIQQGLLTRVQVSQNGRHINLYENPGTVPTMYFAAHAIPVTTVEEATKALISEDFTPGDTVLVESGATPAAALIRGDVHIASSEEGRYTAAVSNPNPVAILVLTQTYYPGWHAAIDGREIPVAPVNIKHIGVRVPQGNHTITFWYMPNSFVYGAWISGVTVSATIFLMAFGYVSRWHHIRQKAILPPQHRQRSRGKLSPQDTK